MIRSLFLLFALALCNVQLLSQNYCIKDRFSSSALYTDGQIQKDSNIVYGVAKHWNSNVMDTLKMDVFYPKASFDAMPNRPVIVLIFGGGFLEGNRQSMYNMCKEFAKRGYVTATIDYRIGWNCLNGSAAILCLCNDPISMSLATYRATQDTRAALRFLSSKRAQYRIDTASFIVGGVSAGSITALTTAFVDQAEMNARISYGRSTLGPLDSSGNTLTNGYKIRAVIDYCGSMRDTADMSNNKDIAVVSFHDSVDCMVPAYRGYVINCTGSCYNTFITDGSAIVYQKAIRNGVCAELNINPVIGHCQTYESYVVNHASCFLKRLFCSNCNTARFSDMTKLMSCDSMGVSGFGKNITDNGYSIYPNPAGNRVSVHMKSEDDAIIQIYSSTGILIYESTTRSREITITTDGLAEGIYFIRIQQNEISLTDKIVIKR